VIFIKIFAYLGLVSFMFNNLLINEGAMKIDYSVFLKGFNTNIITADNYFGVCFDLVIKIIFNINILNIQESLMMFGVK
jgi:hypothetical protein